MGYFGSWCDVGITASEMLDSMRRHDIERSIISYPDNTVTSDALRQYPEALAGLAWVDPGQGERASADLVQLVTGHGLRGVKLHPLFHAYAANDAVVFPHHGTCPVNDIKRFMGWNA